MNQMACWTDSQELNRYPAEVEVEESPLTDTEKMIEWLFDDWVSAHKINMFEEWNEIRLMLHGATQMIPYASSNFAVRGDIRLLRQIAFENGIECIRAGRFEGATA